MRTFRRPAGHGPAQGAAARTDRATLVKGIGVSGLNPKGLLVFLAVLPQFATPRGAWPLAVQLAVLGLVFTLTCAAFYLGLGLRPEDPARLPGCRTCRHPGSLEPR